MTNNHKRFEERKEKQAEYKDNLKFYKKVGALAGLSATGSAFLILKFLGII